MTNEKPCISCGQLISPSETTCPLCKADQASPPPAFTARHADWTFVDTWRIGFGIWLNLFVLMIGALIASLVLGAVIGTDDSVTERAGTPELSPLSGASGLSSLSSGKILFGLVVFWAVLTPFFAWCVGNSIRLMGDGFHRRKP